jgi:hypothetical protein
MKEFLSEHPILSVVLFSMVCGTIMYVADACVDAIDIAHQVATPIDTPIKD